MNRCINCSQYTERRAWGAGDGECNLSGREIIFPEKKVCPQYKRHGDIKKSKKCKDTAQDEAIATLEEIDRKHDNQFAMCAVFAAFLSLWCFALSLIVLTK